MSEPQPPALPTEPQPPTQPGPPPAPAVAWQAPPEEAGPAPGVEFASHGARLVAYIIDSLIVTALFFVLFLPGSFLAFSGASVVGGEIVGMSAALGIAIFLVFALGTLLVVLYFPFFWARGGQTPGMRPFGLRVVQDADGSRIGWGTALLRLVGLWVAGAVFYIGFIWIFVDKRRRGWHDLIAGTVVVRRH